MTQYANTFEGGSNGTTITTANSGGASGDAFDGVTVGAGATAAFDNAHAAHGSLSLKLATGATNTTTTITKQFPAATATAAVRFYLYITGAPGSAFVLAQFRNSAGTQRLSLRLNTAAKLVVVSASGSVLLTTTNALPTGQWVRVEVYAVTLDGTTGAATLAYFTSPDGATADETLSTSAANFGGTGDRIAIGMPATNTTNVGPFWIDDFAVNDTGAAIGSAAAPATADPGAWGAIPI